jgi:hypothetical protein
MYDSATDQQPPNFGLPGTEDNVSFGHFRAQSRLTGIGQGRALSCPGELADTAHSLR